MPMTDITNSLVEIINGEGYGVFWLLIILFGWCALSGNGLGALLTGAAGSGC